MRDWMEDKIEIPKSHEFKRGYNQAIDDFAERLTHKIKSEIDDCADELEWIEEIAKQIRILEVTI